MHRKEYAQVEKIHSEISKEEVRSRKEELKQFSTLKLTQT